MCPCCTQRTAGLSSDWFVGRFCRPDISEPGRSDPVPVACLSSCGLGGAVEAYGSSSLYRVSLLPSDLLRLSRTLSAPLYSSYLPRTSYLEYTALSISLFPSTAIMKSTVLGGVFAIWAVGVIASVVETTAKVHHKTMSAPEACLVPSYGDWNIDSSPCWRRVAC